MIIHHRLALGTAFLTLQPGAVSVTLSQEMPAVTSPVTDQDRIVITGSTPTAEPQLSGRPETSAALDTAQTGPAVSHLEGRIAINLAAGHGNQQINAAVVSMGDTAWSGASGLQTTASDDVGNRTTHIALTGTAFSNISGMVGINVAAGSLNQAANLATVAIGQFEALPDLTLSQARASTEPSGSTGGTGARNDTIAISDGAFRDSSGLIQVNLIGGERNSSANTFVLNVLGEGQP